MGKMYRLARALHATPWAIDPPWIDEMLARIEVGQALADPAAARVQRPAASMRGAVAVVPVNGVLTQKGSVWQAIFGGTSCDAVSAMISDALADPSVGSILLDINSPGGSVFGVSELASKIMDARATKPIYGIANSMAASAAYWIGSACTELMVTPGGQVGSIGVFVTHEDYSAALADAGVSVSVISAGKYKTEGNPYGPLTDEARAALQSSVDSYYAMFVKAVAAGRRCTQSAVTDGMGQGRLVGAAQAAKFDMVDGVATFEQAVARAAGARSAARSARAEITDVEVEALAAETIDVADPVDPPTDHQSASDETDALKARFMFGRR